MKRVLILLAVIAVLLVFAVPAATHNGAQYVAPSYVETYIINHYGRGWASCWGETSNGHGWVAYAPNYIYRYQQFFCDSSHGGERWHTNSSWGVVKDWSNPA